MKYIYKFAKLYFKKKIAKSIKMVVEITPSNFQL